MYIYNIARSDDTGYDEQCAVIVIAPNEKAARQFAATECGDEGPDRWFIPSTTANIIGQAITNLDVGIVCRDFRAG